VVQGFSASTGIHVCRSSTGVHECKGSTVLHFCRYSTCVQGNRSCISVHVYRFSTSVQGNSSSTSVHSTVVVQQCWLFVVVQGYKGTRVVQWYMHSKAVQGITGI
jgi:hypothetical protein